MERTSGGRGAEQHDGGRQWQGRGDHDGRSPPHRKQNDHDHDSGPREKIQSEVREPLVRIASLVEQNFDRHALADFRGERIDDRLRLFGPLVDTAMGLNFGGDVDGPLSVDEPDFVRRILPIPLDLRDVAQA